MTCSEFKTALLTASRAELRGELSGAIGEHLRECASCRRLALSVEAQNEMLAEMLLARRATGASDAVVRSLRGRIAAIAAVPVAAALIGVAVISLRGAPTNSAQAPGTLTTANGVSIKPSAGQKATQIPSSNPKVTIIWLSEGDTE